MSMTEVVAAAQDARMMRDAYARKIAEAVADGRTPDAYYVEQYVIERDAENRLYAECQAALDGEQ